MNYSFILCLFVLCVLASEAQADEPPGGLVDRLNQNQLQEAFQILTRHSLRPEAVRDPLELNRAALQGLLERLAPGVGLVAGGAGKEEKPAASASGAALHTELVAEFIAYVRPGTYAEEEIAAVRAKLREFQGKKAEVLLLDLRAPGPDADYLQAAHFLDLFTGEQARYFSITRPDQTAPPRQYASTARNGAVWTKEIVLLFDGESINIAETIAAVLGSRGKLMSFGEKTAGRSVEYQEIALGKEIKLRYAAAEVRLPEGRSIFQNGVTPQVAIPREALVKKALLERSSREGLAPFLELPKRVRFNEDALVTGQNPEIEEQLRKNRGESAPPAPVIDATLRQAVDYLKARRFLKKL